MAEGCVFLSYSREQLYFAEGLTVRLQRAGIPVWMDLQKLEPGGNWMEQIQTALQRSNSLILVASRRALKSPYVQQEWHSALDAGKRVVIALYEEVDLPPALQTALLVDFRGSFKRGVSILVGILKQAHVQHDPIQHPGWWNLPRKLPPGIRLIAWMLILAAIITPLIAPIIRFPIVSPIVWFVNCLLLSGVYLWSWWGLMHHTRVTQSMFLGLLFPFFYYGFYRFSNNMLMGLSADFFGWWLGYILFVSAIQSLFYWTLGPEMLRWSTPGEEAEMQIIRRWFNKARHGKTKDITAPAFQNALAVRSSMAKDFSSYSAMQQPVIPVSRNVLTEKGTYSLHYAPADFPVVKTLRRAVAREKLRELASGGDVQVAILTENFPRSKLQELLDSQARVIVLLAGNVAVGEDKVLERAMHLQLTDYRDRSVKILNALARTLKHPDEASLPVGVEITPKSLQATILPPGGRQVGQTVLALGAFLVLGGVVSLLMAYLGLARYSPTDLYGLLIGLVMLKIGKSFWYRRTISLLFIPILAFSTWLGMAILFTSFFMYSSGLPNRLSELIFTFGDIFSDADWFCFSTPSLIFIPLLIINLHPRLHDWLPGPVRRISKRDRFAPNLDIDARRWIRNAWLIAFFIVFGLGVAMYGVYYFIGNVMVDF